MIFFADSSLASKEFEISEEFYVSVRIIENVGVNAIPAFHEKVFEQLNEILNELDTNEIIIDLRNNIGGLIDAAADSSGLFIPEGIVFTLQTDGEPSVDYITDGRKTEYNLAVLVNAHTASAAEIFTAAVQETGSGVIVGIRTTGKTSVQKVTRTDDGAERHTVGRYLTRNGADITNIGVTPDLIVRNEYAGNVLIDHQLQKALEFLHKIIIRER